MIENEEKREENRIEEKRREEKRREEKRRWKRKGRRTMDDMRSVREREGSECIGDKKTKKCWRRFWCVKWLVRKKKEEER